MKNRPTQPQSNFARECQSWLLHLYCPLPSLAQVHMVLHTHCDTHTHLTTGTRIVQNQTEFHEKQQRFQHNPEKWQWGKTVYMAMPVLKFTLASMSAKNTCVWQRSFHWLMILHGRALEYPNVPVDHLVLEVSSQCRLCISKSARTKFYNKEGKKKNQSVPRIKH